MAETNTQTDADLMDKPLPLWWMLILPFYTGFIVAIFLFPFAGDWRWLEAWAFTLTFAANMTISYAVINVRNPRVLRNRMKFRKEGVTEETRASAGSDRILMPLMSIGFFGAFILPALAHRWGWPSLPLWLEMFGLLLTNIGLIILNRAILQNPFASKLLDINKDQSLVDTGLYAKVRHPLYAGGILMILAIPVALGSLWALIPAAIAALTLVLRIGFEEEMLVHGMEGYREYQARVKYKLVPGIY